MLPSAVFWCESVQVEETTLLCFFFSVVNQLNCEPLRHIYPPPPPPQLPLPPPMSIMTSGRQSSPLTPVYDEAYDGLTLLTELVFGGRRADL